MTFFPPFSELTYIYIYIYVHKKIIIIINRSGYDRKILLRYKIWFFAKSFDRSLTLAAKVHQISIDNDKKLNS